MKSSYAGGCGSQLHPPAYDRLDHRGGCQDGAEEGGGDPNVQSAIEHRVVMPGSCYGYERRVRAAAREGCVERLRIGNWDETITVAMQNQQRRGTDCDATKRACVTSFCGDLVSCSRSQERAFKWRRHDTGFQWAARGSRHKVCRAKPMSNGLHSTRLVSIFSKRPFKYRVVGGEPGKRCQHRASRCPHRPSTLVFSPYSAP